MKRFLLLYTMIFITLSLGAQNFAGTIGYLEVGGLGGAYTVNVEQNVFNNKKWHGQFRVGYGQYNLFQPERHFRGAPVSFSMFDKATNHHKEIGFGLSYIEGMTDTYDDAVSKSIFVAPIFAYRFQQQTGGIFFKIQYVPMVKVVEFTDDVVFRKAVGKLYHYPGVAVGYYFRKKTGE